MVDHHVCVDQGDFIFWKKVDVCEEIMFSIFFGQNSDQKFWFCFFGSQCEVHIIAINEDKKGGSIYSWIGDWICLLQLVSYKWHVGKTFTEGSKVGRVWSLDSKEKSSKKRESEVSNRHEIEKQQTAQADLSEIMWG